MRTADLDPDQLRQFARNAERLGLSAKGKARVEWLLHYCEHGRSVTATCRQFSISRMSFYRALERLDEDDPTSLNDRPRPSPRRQALPRQIVRAIERHCGTAPHMGKRGIAAAIRQDYGFPISAASVQRLIAREGFRATGDAGPTRLSTPPSAFRIAKRSVVVACLLADIAFIAAFLATALWERNAAPAPRDTTPSLDAAVSHP